MSEIRKTAKLKGYKLTKKDIEELCEYLAEGITSKSDVTFYVNLNDREIRKDSTEELFGDPSIPPVVHNLKLSCGAHLAPSSEWRFAGVYLSEEDSSLEVVGIDEIWVEGKCQRIKNFLEHTASKLRCLLATFGGVILFNLLVAIAVVLSAFVNKPASLIALVVAVVVLILFGVFGLRMMPMNVIYLKDVRENWLKRNASTLITAAMGAAIGAIITFALTKLFG